MLLPAEKALGSGKKHVVSLTFVELAIFLAAAVVAVPITRWLGLGAVIGYLVAGVAIGPFGFGLVYDVDSILHFAEFGVVMLLFLIGLELQPRRLLIMRRQILGLGVGQLLVTTVPLVGACLVLGLGIAESLVLGFALSLSSTAFALQILAEKNQLATRHGRGAFSILLLQDIAVIPMLALLPLLAVGEAAPEWGDVAKALVAIAALVVLGRYGLRYALRIVARADTNEVFIALSLLTVVGAAMLMEWAGLSMGLGAFIAGVLLADSEYRHALQVHIEPFEGLLLGLFFIAVGMAVNLGLLAEMPLAILGLVTGLVTIKAAAIYGLARRTKMAPMAALRLATVISQGGEFAFVLLSAAVGAYILDQRTADIVILVVSVSMLTTPLLYIAVEALDARRTARDRPEYDTPPREEPLVIIAGFGRVGQMIGRILVAKKIPFAALESNPQQIDFMRRFGAKVYYGDSSRLDILRAMGIDKASAFVLTVDDVERSLATARVVREHFPDLPIYARARDRRHAYRLMDLGIELIERETFHSSLVMARQVLECVGLTDGEAVRAVETFRQHDIEHLRRSQKHHTDEQRLIYLAKQAAEELEELFAQDAARETQPERQAAE